MPNLLKKKETLEEDVLWSFYDSFIYIIQNTTNITRYVKRHENVTQKSRETNHRSRPISLVPEIADIDFFKQP